MEPSSSKMKQSIKIRKKHWNTIWIYVIESGKDWSKNSRIKWVTDIMILNDLYQSKLGLEAPRFSNNSLKLLSKCCIFWTDRAILATLSGRYSILIYNAIYNRVSRYGAYKRVNVTKFLDKNHQTSQTYWKIMLCLFIDLLIKSG